MPAHDVALSHTNIKEEPTDYHFPLLPAEDASCPSNTFGQLRSRREPSKRIKLEQDDNVSPDVKVKLEDDDYAHVKVKMEHE